MNGPSRRRMRRRDVVGEDEWALDLAGTRDSSLVGGIGEMIAWKYLRGRGIWSHRIGGWYPFPVAYPFTRGEPSYQLGGVSGGQVDYLKNMCLHGPRRYDFVGVRRRRGPHGLADGVEEVYLVEVKATGPGPGRQDLHGHMRGRVPEDVETAKALGFTVLLVVVRLLDNWGCKVTCREL